MNEHSHPSLDVLKQFLQQPHVDSLTSVSLHLSTCCACRKTLETLQLLSAQSLEKKDVYDDIQTDMVDYVEGRLPDKQREVVRETLQNNKSAMKQALHYACSSTAMKRHFVADNTIDNRQKKHANIWTVFKINTPLWISFPAGAVASLLAVWLLLPLIQFNPDYQIVTYQDEPQLFFQSKDSLSGIGFFQQANKQSQLYNKINVNLLDNQQLHLQWPPVKQAISYTMKVDVFDKGQRRSIGKVSSIKTDAVFDTRSIALKRRYEWSLSGQTKDNRLFYARGGFVIH